MKGCLIVDDSPMARRVLRRIVEADGFEVREAGDGWAALAACAARMPDVVLLDWRMPLMDGPEFARELRRCFGAADPVLILCAIAADLPAVERTRGIGVDGWIAKPFDAAAVRGALRRIAVLRPRPAPQRAAA